MTRRCSCGVPTLLGHCVADGAAIVLLVGATIIALVFAQFGKHEVSPPCACPETAERPEAP